MTTSGEERGAQALKLNKDKTECGNTHIGLDLVGLLCLQKYAWTLGIFGAYGSSKAQLLCVCMLLDM